MEAAWCLFGSPVTRLSVRRVPRELELRGRARQVCFMLPQLVSGDRLVLKPAGKRTSEDS